MNRVPQILRIYSIPKISRPVPALNTTSYSRAVGDGQVGQVLTFNLTNFATVNTFSRFQPDCYDPVFNVVSNFDSHFGAKRRIAYFVRHNVSSKENVIICFDIRSNKTLSLLIFNKFDFLLYERASYL